jgi:hypothetical protein
MALDRESQLRVSCARAHALEWEQKLRLRQPPGFPRVEIVVDRTRVRWPGMPWASDTHLRRLEAIEDLLNDPDHERWWWAPLRAGRKPPRPVPTNVTADYTREKTCSTQP